ncbi:MAG: hypothetical protein A4E28_03092 [Methanocella sp. PtaU1.Bin125]|nr:MAG: hypothetical protein A4E28_03092 [Methanocella sp. PtaU1.Bin125]
MRRKIALALLLILAMAAAGCVSGIQASPYAGAVTANQIYDIRNASYWKYGVVMSAGGTNATWNMTVNNTWRPDGESQMTAGTVGNGMDILYDIGYNASTYRVDRMHAKGYIGDFYQDRDVSPLQIQTLPDTGLLYYFVPMQYMGNVTVKDASGRTAGLHVFSATDNRGFTLTYWAHPAMPLPPKIEMTARDFKITMNLLDYKLDTGD